LTSLANTNVIFVVDKKKFALQSKNKKTSKSINKKDLCFKNIVEAPGGTQSKISVRSHSVVVASTSLQHHIVLKTV